MFYVVWLVKWKIPKIFQKNNLVSVVWFLNFLDNYLLSHKLQRFDTFSYKLPTMTFNPIKLSSYNNFPLSVSQRNGQWRDNFFPIFVPILGGYKCYFIGLKWGKNGRKKKTLHWPLILNPLIDGMGKVS